MRSINEQSITRIHRSALKRLARGVVALSTLAAVSPLFAADPRTPPAPTAEHDPAAPSLPTVPQSVADLKAIERRVEEVTARVSKSVVGVQAGGGQGSGVIVTKDGYVLTAGHVSGEPGRDVNLMLSDGRRVRAKSLGTNQRIDSGLIKITEPGDWPAVEIGKSADLEKGQWVLALGHPGGFRRDRPPVLRLGRILNVSGSDDFVMTDCTLVGGDSGGPLFDLDGKVVGIHSRIGMSTLANMHTPADTFSETWDRLAKGESWGQRFTFLTPRGPMLGVGGAFRDDDATAPAGAQVGSVTEGGPAEKAGVKVGDVIVAFNGQSVASMQELAQLISKKKAGDEVQFEVKRGGRTITLSATLARRPRE